MKRFTSAALGLALVFVAATGTPRVAAAQNFCYDCQVNYPNASFCQMHDGSHGWDQCIDYYINGIPACWSGGFPCGNGGKTFLAPDGSAQLAGAGDLRTRPDAKQRNGNTSMRLFVDPATGVVKDCRGVILKREQSALQRDAVKVETSRITI